MAFYIPYPGDPSNEKHEPGPEVLAMLEALAGETDRGCVLAGSQWLADLLGDVLRAQFFVNGIEDREIKKLLKGFNAPLGSFAVRISLCRALALISQRTADTLNAIREIRNHCAHSYRLVSLSDPEIDHWVRLLAKSFARKDDGQPPENNREAVNGAVTWLAWELPHIAIAIIKQRAEQLGRILSSAEELRGTTQKNNEKPPANKQRDASPPTDNPKPE